jgi:hypothetical protein
MTSINWERWARAAGIGFAVALIAAFIVYGDPPKVNASTSDIVGFFDGDRGRVLTSLIIFGIAFLLLLWFVGAVANALREAGEGRLAATSIGMAATFVGIQAVTGALAGALALNIAATGDEGVVQAFNTLLSTADVISAYPLAGLILAVTAGLARSRLIAGAWYLWLGLLVSILALLHGTNWATSGFWSANGGYVWISSISALIWTVITSWMLFSAAGAPAPERAAVPTT